MSSAEQAASASAAQTTEHEGLLDQILEIGIRPADADEKSQAVQLIETFVRTQAQPGMIVSKDAQRSIDAWMSVLDQKISEQLNEVMHHEDFQKLEGSWRGLHYLVHQSETGGDLKIKVLNVKRSIFWLLLKTAIFRLKRLKRTQNYCTCSYWLMAMCPIIWHQLRLLKRTI